jgi:hypothetical protein
MCARIQAEVERLEHILAHRADCETVNVAALTVHFDDSGTHPEAPVAVVAGWIAPVAQWKRFTRQWNKAKLEYGFETLHMAEFAANNPHSEFADKEKWNERKKTIVMRRLRSIISDHVIQGFCTAVIKKDYDEIFPIGSEVRTAAGQFHYTYALRGVIGWIEKWRKEKGVQQPIEYIFDFMSKGAAKTEINKVFEEAVRTTDPLRRYGVYPGCHSFGNKKEILPLQAADMFAWLSQKAHAFERQQLPMPDYALNAWNEFLGRGNIIAKYQTREQLQDFVEKKPKAVVVLPPDWNSNSGRKKKKST